MKLSKDTQEIFKNYASINSNLMLREGNKLSTWTENKSVISEVVLTETFPQNFGIYDVNEFLGVVSLFSDPDITFNEDTAIISEGKNRVRYKAAEETTLKVPTKSIAFPEAEINFSLSAANLNMIHKTASVLRAADVSIVGDGSTVTAVVGDKKNATGNSFSEPVGQTDKTFKVNLKVENLKMLPGDYAVSISSKKISRFKGAGDLVYYVAVEADSSFDL